MMNGLDDPALAYRFRQIEGVHPNTFDWFYSDPGTGFVANRPQSSQLSSSMPSGMTGLEKL